MREAGTRVAVVCPRCSIVDVSIDHLPAELSLVDRRGRCPECGTGGCAIHASNPGGFLRACRSTL